MSVKYRIVIPFIFVAGLFSQHTIAVEGEAGRTEDQSFRDWLWHYLTDGASVTVGLGGRETAFEVTRLGTNDTGKFKDSREDAYFLSYNTRASYFKQSNWGYGWMFNLSTLELDQQETSDGVVENLGTSVDGYMAYVVPSFFYNFGDKYRGRFVRTGLGLGLGLAKFDGDIVLTKSSQPNDRVSISNGTSKLYFAVGFFVEAQWNYFTFRLGVAGPTIEQGDYKISISDSSIMIGLTHYLDL